MRGLNDVFLGGGSELQYGIIHKTMSVYFEYRKRVPRVLVNNTPVIDIYLW